MNLQQKNKICRIKRCGFSFNLNIEYKNTSVGLTEVLVLVKEVDCNISSAEVYTLVLSVHKQVNIG